MSPTYQCPDCFYLIYGDLDDVIEAQLEHQRAHQKPRTLDDAFAPRHEPDPEFCIHRHLRTPANTGYRPGTREKYCRTCANESRRRIRAAKKESGLASMSDLQKRLRP